MILCVLQQDKEHKRKHDELRHDEVRSQSGRKDQSSIILSIQIPYWLGFVVDVSSF